MAALSPAAWKSVGASCAACANACAIAETKAGVDLSSRYQREQELDAGKYKDVCGVLPEVSGIFQSAQSAFA